MTMQTDPASEPADAMYRAYDTWFKTGRFGLMFRWHDGKWIRTTVSKSEVIVMHRSRKAELNQARRIRNIRAGEIE
jgi:hypothetical protein